ncbi:PREDICTED: uncharacterized protein LOC106748535 [Dinoponera quadriceps]|uniref:Uncharacterized protein LOC106748535 n=1 Tax=Dinoponera quadriceps TaxID=609295 RepID=A0A6P3XX62_DINQU|nr:PREDICTED: uncharacterized protein LOC106748535 [Dinoponera quadriceps]
MEIIERPTDESLAIDMYIRSTSEGQQGRRSVVRSRTASLQQRQHRLRSYGVSAAHGDGQTLLPISNSNSNSSNSQQTIVGGGGASNRHLNNSQQQYSSTSETQPRRVLPSTSTSTSTSTTVVGNSHQLAMPPYLDPRNQQGMRTIRLVASKPRATR